MPADLDKLQGAWSLTSLEVDGQEVPAIALNDSRIIVKGTEFTSTSMGAKYKGELDLDPRKKPKTLDLIFTSRPEKGNRNRGIYKLDGDTWTICLATRGDTRPTKFATTPGTGLALETLHREDGRRRSEKGRSQLPNARHSASKVQASVAEVAASDPATDLEGEWAMLSGVFNGAAMDQAAVKWCKRLTRGSVTKVVAGPQVFLHAKFTLDRGQTPAAIDYINVDGPNKGKAQAGIFELTGDKLSVCMSAPGQSRPSDFSSKAGDGRSYTTWRLLNK